MIKLTQKFIKYLFKLPNKFLIYCVIIALHRQRTVLQRKIKGKYAEIESMNQLLITKFKNKNNFDRLTYRFN